MLGEENIYADLTEINADSDEEILANLNRVLRDRYSLYLGANGWGCDSSIDGPTFHTAYKWICQRWSDGGWRSDASSYWLKHILERDFAAKNERVYCSNGAFIAAALADGFIAYDIEGYNCLFRKPTDAEYRVVVRHRVGLERSSHLLRQISRRVADLLSDALCGDDDCLQDVLSQCDGIDEKKLAQIEIGILVRRFSAGTIIGPTVDDEYYGVKVDGLGRPLQ